MSFRILDHCDGCMACLHQCPERAIRGGRDLRHEVDPRRCVDCGVCGQICPIEAVLDDHGKLASRVPRPLRARPVFDDGLCNGCAMCVDVCPFRCIALVGRRYDGAAFLARVEACVGCGECERTCIKGALQLGPFDLARYDPRAEFERLTLAVIGDEPPTSRR